MHYGIFCIQGQNYNEITLEPTASLHITLIIWRSIEVSTGIADSTVMRQTRNKDRAIKPGHDVSY